MTALAPAPAVAADARSRWDAVFDAEGSVRAVAVMRIALGPIVLLHLRPFLRDARAGVSYDDHFWEPFIGWLPELPSGLWFATLWIGAVAAVLVTIGLWTRLATAVAFAVVAGNMLLSQTHFRHNRTFLAILLLGLALLPAGRVLSVDAWRRRRGGRPPLPDRVPLWPLWLLRVQVCLVYVASGVSKLIDPDWFGGLVLWDRVVRYRHVLDPTPVPGWAIDVLTSRWLYYGVAPVAVATELFIGIGLWFARTRLAAIWVAVVFHLAIEISAKVEVFSYAAIAALAIWVTPVTRARVVLLGGAARSSHVWAGLVHACDWFARFRVELTGADAPALAVRDRDGHIRTGPEAAQFLLSRLPATFVLAAPLRPLARHRRRDTGERAP